MQQQARWYRCSTEGWLAVGCGTHPAPRNTQHATRNTHQALVSAGQAALAAGTEIGKQAGAAAGPAFDQLAAQV